MSDDLGRYHVGDRVRVLTDVPGGNPRTPRYVRGWTGTVVLRHGIVENPLDHHDAYPPLYSVVFRLPDGRDPHDETLADVHEEWLAPADSVDQERRLNAGAAPPTRNGWTGRRGRQDRRGPQ